METPVDVAAEIQRELPKKDDKNKVRIKIKTAAIGDRTRNVEGKVIPISHPHNHTVKPVKTVVDIDSSRASNPLLTVIHNSSGGLADECNQDELKGKRKEPASVPVPSRTFPSVVRDTLIMKKQKVTVPAHVDSGVTNAVIECNKATGMENQVIDDTSEKLAGLAKFAEIDELIKIDHGINRKLTKANNVNNNLSLRTRTSPKILVDTVKLLNDKQRAAVRDIGLASLLGITLDGIPCRLGFYVVDNLDITRMNIKLRGGTIPITVESIHRLLGVPTGGLDLNSIPPSIGVGDISKSWRKQFSKGRMRPRDVMKAIKESGDDGPDFKLNFLVIMVSTLAECSRVGCCNVGFLSRVHSVDTIKEIDWAKYIFDCLKTSKIGWKRDSLLTYYAGPITYLTLLYVESTLCEQLYIDPHKHPISKWTMETIRRRQDIEIDEGGLGTAILKSSESGGHSASSHEVRWDSSWDHVGADRSMSEEELFRILDKRIDELDFRMWEADTLLEDAIERYPNNTEFDIIKAKLASMFKNSKWDRASNEEEDDDAIAVHAHTPKKHLDRPSSSRTTFDTLSTEDATPHQPTIATFAGTLSPLSQFWYSPTLHEVVDRVSNKKTESEAKEHDPMMQRKDKGKQVVCESPNDGFKISKQDMIRRGTGSSSQFGMNKKVGDVSQEGLEKVTRSVKFADFSPPKFDLGLSPTQQDKLNKCRSHHFGRPTYGHGRKVCKEEKQVG